MLPCTFPLLACPSGPTIQIVSMKKPMNYPILFGYLGDLAKFSWILHEHRIFLSLVFFVKIWQCLASCSCQSKRLIIARCKIKWLCSEKNLCSWSIWENLAKSPKYPNRIREFKVFFFTDTICIVGPLGQATSRSCLK